MDDQAVQVRFSFEIYRFIFKRVADIIAISYAKLGKFVQLLK